MDLFRTRLGLGDVLLFLLRFGPQREGGTSVPKAPERLFQVIASGGVGLLLVFQSMLERVSLNLERLGQRAAAATFVGSRGRSGGAVGRGRPGTAGGCQRHDDCDQDQAGAAAQSAQPPAQTIAILVGQEDQPPQHGQAAQRDQAGRSAPCTRGESIRQPMTVSMSSRRLRRSSIRWAADVQVLSASF